LRKDFPTLKEAEEYKASLDLADTRDTVLCPALSRWCRTDCASFRKAYITQGMKQIWFSDDDFEGLLRDAYVEGYDPKEYANQMVWYPYIVAGHRCGNKSVNEEEDWL